MHKNPEKNMLYLIPNLTKLSNVVLGKTIGDTLVKELAGYEFFPSLTAFPLTIGQYCAIFNNENIQIVIFNSIIILTLAQLTALLIVYTHIVTDHPYNYRSAMEK